MSASISFTAATAYKAYVEKFSSDLIFLLFHKFKTGSLIRPHEGVKGQEVLTEFLLGDIVQRWSKTFDPLDDAMDFVPRVLKVVPAKVDLQIFPQEFEQSYLGMARRPGFNVDDLPFEAFILMKIIEKVQEQLETAVWQGVETGAPGAGDPLTDLFDGFLQKIADAIVATDVTAVATGAITASNAVASLEAMWNALPAAYKEAEMTFFTPYPIYQHYLTNYRTDFGKYTGMSESGIPQRVRLDFGNGWIVPIAGMGNSGRVLLTQAENLRYGYDLQDDMSTITIEKNHRALDFMMDFKIGVEFGMLKDGPVVVNDQA